MSAASPEFAYADLLPTGPDQTSYRLLTTEGVETIDSPAGALLQVDPGVLRLLTAEAMHDIAHYLRPAHLGHAETTPSSRCLLIAMGGGAAVWKFDVEDFPAFIVVDDKGNDFFTDPAKPVGSTIQTRSAEST